MLSAAGHRSTVLLATHQTEDVAALCQHVVVVDGGRVAFDGTPGQLTATASGRVWLAAERAAGAQIAWRTADGDVRNVGDQAPEGAHVVSPSLEDAYLLLVGDAATEAAA